MIHMTNLNTANFEGEVINSNKPVAVDFWAAWCGPCRMLAPVFEELSGEYDGKVKFCKVNIDEQGALAAQYGVVSIPTVIIFKDGKEAKRIVGAHDADEYADAFDALI